MNHGYPLRPDPGAPQTRGGTMRHYFDDLANDVTKHDENKQLRAQLESANQLIEQLLRERVENAKRIREAVEKLAEGL